jgi:hypothetical protein
LIDCLLFYVPLQNLSLIWRRHHCPSHPPWVILLNGIMGNKNQCDNYGVTIDVETHQDNICRKGRLYWHTTSLLPPQNFWNAYYKPNCRNPCSISMCFSSLPTNWSYNKINMIITLIKSKTCLVEKWEVCTLYQMKWHTFI